jgi:peptidyl-prolyl cis-trans isomerase C
MNKTLILMVTCLLLTACQQEQSLTDDSPVLARVGEVNITGQMVTAYLLNQGVAQASNEQQAAALDALVKQQALVNLANKSELQLSALQQQSIELLKNQALAELMVKEHLRNNPISEADIKAEYDQVTRDLKGHEYHVRHMLYQDETQAIEALDEINQGAGYPVVEQLYLQQVGQVKNVGDIGWVNLRQVPESFRAPLQSLSPGQVHQQVVVSQFGVHVLYLEDKRELAPPDFATVKDGIRKSLEQKAAERFKQVAQVKSKAVILQDE